MLIAFASLTGNTQRFAEKLGYRNVHINGGTIVDEPFVLITYTIGKGEIPKEVSTFLKNNAKHMKAVIGSGNRIWGKTFARASHLITEQYTVPLLHTFEVSGYKRDVELALAKIKEIEGMNTIVKMDRTQ